MSGTSSGFDADVAALADQAGIAAGYTDAFGHRVETSLETRRGMLAALGLPVETEAEFADSRARVAALRGRPLPALAVVEARRAASLPLRGRAGRWHLADERGGTREGRAGATVELPPLTPGYHRLTLDGVPGETTVIAAPTRCWRPRAHADADTRDWGLAAQLYGLRSEKNLGIGTYADAGRAAAEAGALGAAFLGLSPVHALFGSDRGKVSPYSPSSRLFLETLHLDPAALPGFAGSEAARLLDAARDRIAALREMPLVDHAGVWEVLEPVLAALWQAAPARAGRDAALSAFRAGTPGLEAHATFEALSAHFRTDGARWLGEWPDGYRRAGTPEVAAFAAGHAEAIAYQAWLQYLADRQLGDAAARAHGAGMRVGLYRDLAVGADRGGSEVWSNPERFSAGLSIGAPPDLLAPQGQDWGLPPFDPLALEASGLAAFRALVTSNMRHAGAIRIDHAFQLARLFLIPTQGSARDGAYVAMPFEAMLAVLRLESHRAHCLVIAEDLGTAPEGFSDAIMASGLLSYRVLAFERDHAGFKRPVAYPREALAAISTHDLPTFVGWWRGLDTDLRQTLGLYTAEQGEAERAERVRDRAQLAGALHAEHLLPTADVGDTAPFEATARYLGRTPSVLAAIQYEDVIGEVGQANMPGTTEGYPSWRRKLPQDLATIAAPGGPLAKLAASLALEGRGPRAGTLLASPPPRATYRLQFHAGFTFADAAKIAPYLARLGISHVYASPIHKARPGSTHGYDIVDHGAINPELGGEEGFVAFSEVLQQHGLKLLLDIVPNHMGVGGADNPWWLSTLEWGALSPHAHAFDIDWERLGAHGRLIIPFLGDRYGQALENGVLGLRYDADEGALSAWHYEHRLPISPLAYPIVLDRALAVAGDLDDPSVAEALSISERLRRMSEETSPDRRAGFPAEADGLKQRLAAAVAASPTLQAGVERALALVNGVKGHPDSFGTLHRILEMQAYRLAHWRVASSDINYRRFFDVNGLAGLRVEQSDIFHRAHETVFRHVAAGRIHGLRIDHIDGLADPSGYAEALQAAVGPGFYVVVEKILEPGERLRPWPIAGTTGYDALNELDGVMVDASRGADFSHLYGEISGEDGRYGALLRGAKTEILETSFASELEVLTSDLKRVADAGRSTRDFSVNAIRRALVEIVARFPVYRTYIAPEPDAEEIEREDRELIEGAVKKAKRRSSLPDHSVHDFAADVLLARVETGGVGQPDTALVGRFRRRFQQLTGPVMAKSLEDTLFYRYVRFLALNEVGGDPGHFGLPVEEFHALQAARARAWPNAMLATATHDTKRGEDTRARLLPLSQMPEWTAEAWALWQDVAPRHLGEGEEGAEPDANDQYMLLQAILGAWPLELMEHDDPATIAEFRGRLDGFVEKALREAKRHSSWVDVDEGYEGATHALVAALVAPNSAFLAKFRPLARRLAGLGLVAGLARTALKCSLPGLPDTYQGTEFWDFSFVDPDNRRPVDYAARAAALDDRADAGALVATWWDGRIKQRVLARLLADRAAEPGFYAEAGYEPVAAEGPRAGSLIAFRRAARLPGTQAGDLLVAVPRLVADLIPETDDPVRALAEGFSGTRLPAEGRWRDLVTGREHEAGAGGLAIPDLFAALPVAVLRRID